MVRLHKLALACLVSAGFGLVAHATPDPPRVTAYDVDHAIERATRWILAQQNSDGHWETSQDNTQRYWAGDSGLALLALLYAGQNPRSEPMDRGLTWLAQQPLHATYTYAIRAHGLALVPGGKLRARLNQDLGWLVTAIRPRSHSDFGAYGYVAFNADAAGPWADNSNSQFGVLGVWMAEEGGAQRSDMLSYWELVEDRWTGIQNPDGGWGYQRGESTGSMTAAGLATLYVVLDRVHALSAHRKAERLLAAIEQAQRWLGREFTTENPRGEGRWKHYYLYSVERAGRASGRKYFRGRDWFREGAADLLKHQSPDGSWTGGGMTPLQDTAFALMFLSHGRAPLLYSKLEHPPDWSHYHRDVSGLTRYCEQSFERLLNWQIVDLDGPIEDLMEAPVLYLSGKRAWTFSEEQRFKLAQYALRGGLIFAVVPAGGEEFEDSIRALALRLFPEMPLRPAPKDHPLYSGEVQYRFDKPSLMFHVTNGVRTLLLLCPQDVAFAWNTLRLPAREADFQFGANVYLYATDKTTPRSRLETPEIPLAPVEPVRTVRVARVAYSGRWDIESYGWVRLRHYMNNTSRTRLLVTSGVGFDQLSAADNRIAFITGVSGFELNAAELAGLRRFLTSGGTLLADGAAGSREFVEALERHVRAALQVEPGTLARDSCGISGEGVDGAERLGEMKYRRTTRVDRGRDYPLLRAFDTGPRLAVIYSPLDLSAGLLGTQVFACNGYDPESCLRIMQNMLLYANLTTEQKAALSARPHQPARPGQPR